MKQKKIISLLLCLLLIFTLCACGQKSENLPEEIGFSVSLQSTAGTGYYWDCTLSEEGIVTMESEQRAVQDPMPGSPITTDFRFTGKNHGTVTADFCCCQSWDDSVCYLHTCELTVDRDKVVTGDLSRQTARIRPGACLYKLTASDTSIALWTSEDDGSFTFTPLRDGSTTLTFTPLEAGAASERIFYLTVTDSGTISITEETGPKSAETYDSMELLEKKIGFAMKLPKNAEPSEISSVDSIAYTNFTWNGIRFAYAGGDLDRNAFLSADASVHSVAGCSVIIRNSVSTLAAWEKDDSVYCISSEEILSTDDILTLLEEILIEQ